MKKLLLLCICSLLVVTLLAPSVVHADGAASPDAPVVAASADDSAQPVSDASDSAAAAPVFSEKDIELLARVVYAEARGESFLGKVAVANVALNRFESGRYGKSLASILTRPHQFAVAKRTNKECLDAVHFLIDNGLRILPKNAWYFKTSSHEWRGLTSFCRIHGHMFFTAGTPVVDQSKPYVNAQGILVWPNASLWDEQNRSRFIIDKIFVADDAQNAPAAASDVQAGAVAPAGGDVPAAIDFNELDRLESVFKKYEKLLGADTMLL